MKRTFIATALLALGIAASSSAFAQHGNHGSERSEQAHERNYERKDRHEEEKRDKHREKDARKYRGASNHGERYYRDDNRGGGPRHDMRRGQHLSREYRDNRYVVSDWRARRLSAPPRGHHWVQAGNDYVLATIATGIIVQVLLSN